MNGQIPLPIILPPSFHATNDVEVVDENNEPLGLICCCTVLGTVEISNLTDAKYSAYINESTEESVASGVFSFSRDYLVLQDDRYSVYKSDYMETAPIGGGFVHEIPGFELPASYRHSPVQIHAVPNIFFPTEHHRRTSEQSVCIA